MLAESIHNSSIRAREPFLDVPCEGLSGEEQKEMIFGNRGAALQVQGGTLLIRDVEQLTAANQYRLYQLIRFHVCHGADIASLRKVDVRVMVTIARPLSELMSEGRISRICIIFLSVWSSLCRRSESERRIWRQRSRKRSMTAVSIIPAIMC